MSPWMDADAYDGFAEAYSHRWSGWVERMLP